MTVIDDNQDTAVTTETALSRLKLWRHDRNFGYFVKNKVS